MNNSSKSSLRKTFQQKRQGLSLKDHAVFSAACGRSIATLVDGLGPAMVIAGYSAVRGELDISHALETLAERHMLALPVADKASRQLAFRRYHRGDALASGAYGILEPRPEAEAATPNVVLLPLLAFDRRGARLGYGGGHYDATLAQLRAGGRVAAIGVAFSLQEADSLPQESFDQRLDLVITEKEIIRIA